MAKKSKAGTHYRQKKIRQLVAGSDGYARYSPFDDSLNNENFTCSRFQGITIVDTKGC